jgi:hypothetical protein
MLEIIQNRDGMWELWVNRTCVTTEFVTKEAALNYADRFLAQIGALDDGTSETRKEPPQINREQRPPAAQKRLA